MDFSEIFKRNVRRIFETLKVYENNSILKNNLLFDKHNVYNKIFNIEINKDKELEIPIFGRCLIERIIIDKIINNKSDKSIIYKIPLYTNSNIKYCASTTTLLKYLLSASLDSMLAQCVYNNFHYYGGNGLILDSNYNILLLSVLRAKIEEVDDKYVLDYKKPVLYINPLVFTDPTDPLNKIIINKIIPYYTINKIPYIIMYTYSRIKINNLEDNCRKTDIILKDCTSYINSPEPPKVNENVNEDLNNFIVNNIDEIAKMYDK